MFRVDNDHVAAKQGTPAVAPAPLSNLCLLDRPHRLQARRVRDVEDAFERQREKERRAALEQAAEADRAYQKHVRAWEKEERCVAARVPLSAAGQLHVVFFASRSKVRLGCPTPSYLARSSAGSRRPAGSANGRLSRLRALAPFADA